MAVIDRRVFAWLLLPIWQFGGLEQSVGQGSVPRDIRSGQSTDHPIPLVERHVFLQPDLQFIVHPARWNRPRPRSWCGLRLNLSY
jgi:hypothetical protein